MQSILAQVSLVLTMPLVFRKAITTLSPKMILVRTSHLPVNPGQGTSSPPEIIPPSTLNPGVSPFGRLKAVCVVGISLSEGQSEAAIGSSLLFLTNLFSILLAGGAVFALLNLGPASIKGRELTRGAQRKAYMYIALGVLLVTVPLAINGYRVGRETCLEWQIIPIAEGWFRAAESDLKLDNVNVSGNDVEVVVNGFSEPPSTESLGEELVMLIPNLDESTLTFVVSRDLPIPTSVEDG